MAPRSPRLGRKSGADTTPRSQGALSRAGALVGLLLLVLGLVIEPGTAVPPMLSAGTPHPLSSATEFRTDSPVPPTPPAYPVLTAGNGSQMAVYDPADQWIYVVNSGSGNVTIFNGASRVGSVNVGAGPTDAVYDVEDSEVYVTSSTTNSVAILRGDVVVGAVPVRGPPTSAVYDPQDGEVYVVLPGEVDVLYQAQLLARIGTGALTAPASPMVFDPVDSDVYVGNPASKNVSVIAATVLLATIPLPGVPSAIAFDNATSAVDIACLESTTNVTVEIRGSLLVGSVAVGSDPTALAFDPLTREMVVVNTGSDTLTVLNGTRSVATLGVGAGPSDAVFDPGNGTIDVPNRLSGTVSELFGRTVYGNLSVGPYPRAVAYDPSNGNLVVVSDASASTVSNVTFVSTWYSTSFIAGGSIPSGTAWSLKVDGASAVLVNGPQATLLEPAGPHRFSVSCTNTSYASAGGPFDVAYAPLVIQVDFELVLFRANFSEEGLELHGPQWGIAFGAQSASTDTGWMLFDDPNGTYPFRVLVPTGFEASPLSGNVTIDGLDPPTVVIDFGVVPNATYSIEFDEVGLPFDTVWSVYFGTVDHNGVGSIVVYGEANGSYDFEVALIAGYVATPANGTFTIAGANVTLTVHFAPAPPASRPSEFGAYDAGAVAGSVLLAAFALVGLWVVRRRAPTRGRATRPPTGPRDRADRARPPSRPPPP